MFGLTDPLQTDQRAPGEKGCAKCLSLKGLHVLIGEGEKGLELTNSQKNNEFYSIIWF